MATTDFREELGRIGLCEEDADPDPLKQFDSWFQKALGAGLTEPTAVTLATASGDGRPSARTVLLKGVEEGGFVFFTNYRSRKGRDLSENPRGALVFFWASLGRQVCVAGQVTRVSRVRSEAYFKSRPIGSRLGAWASRQSEVLGSREELAARLQEVSERHEDGNVPCPEHWGGFRLVPETVEFWQGRPDRLHDRLRYSRQPDGGWRIERLSP